MSKITIGHDGEFFLLTEEGNVVCSQDIIPGTKFAPVQLQSCMVHRDNAMGEFGTAPASTEDAFVDKVNAGIAEIAGILKDRGYTMLFTPHHIFAAEDLTHPEVLTFGCEPDWDCYIGTPAPAADALAAGCLRSAGGHLHAGFDYKSIIEQQMAAISAEAFVGLYTVLADSDTKRRTLYGQSGRFRPKPYGIEYRPPSNFWYNNEDTMREMFRRMRAAVVYREEMSDLIMGSSMKDHVSEAINCSNKKLALELIDHLKVEERIQYAA